MKDSVATSSQRIELFTDEESSCSLRFSFIVTSPDVNGGSLILAPEIFASAQFSFSIDRSSVIHLTG